MSERPESGGKSEGKRCGGACKHSSTYHQVKWFDKFTSMYYYGCAYVDCKCMNYVATDIKNTDIR
jgi:hypothetical protein